MGCRDAVASGLHWKPFARMMDACICRASSLAHFWSSGSTRCKGWLDPDGKPSGKQGQGPPILLLSLQGVAIQSRPVIVLPAVEHSTAFHV